MELLISFIFVAYSLTLVSEAANGQENDYTFDSDLDSLVSANGIWQWSSRDAFPWSLPDGPDGFAVQYMPGDGDLLYDSEVDIQYGFDYEITYYISSEDAGTTILKIQQLDVEGTVLQDIEEYQSDATSFQWVTVGGTFAQSGVPSRFGVFCQTAGINLVNEPFYGCAIDSITLNIHYPQTTASMTTTSAATTPGNVVDFTFDEGSDGWLLGSNNGATWSWTQTLFMGQIRPSRPNALALLPHDVYSGTALATSPRLRVGDSGSVTVSVEFFLNGNPEFPVYLKFRRRYSYTTYDEDVVLNMDPWGDQVNTQWHTIEQTLDDVSPGDEFNFVLEGNRGIAKDITNYQIMVSRVYIEGVSVVPYEETVLFNFNDGLVGWQAGSMDGGKWKVLPYEDIPPALNVPYPLSTNILMVDRYDIHSGIISIESPPISVEPNTTKELQIMLYIRGSQVYPVIFRIGLKTLDGVYDPLPFIDLTPQGDSNSQAWTTLAQFTPVPVDPRESAFQLVFEVDLGGDMNNLIAIEGFTVRTMAT